MLAGFFFFRVVISFLFYNISIVTQEGADQIELQIEERGGQEKISCKLIEIEFLFSRESLN